MINYPLISVIVPTIGRDTLERTIESIKNSKYPNLEIIIVGTNFRVEDNPSMMFSEKYPGCNYRIITSERKLLPAEAKNIGIESASGKYITFIDDDDTCYPEKFFALSEHLEKHTAFGVFGQYNVRDCYSNEIKNTYCGGCAKVNFDTLILSNYIASGSIMLRKDSVIKFDETLPYGWGEDYKLWLELLGKRYRIDFIPVPVYVWTQNLKEGFTSMFNKKGINWRQLTKNIQDEARKTWTKN